MNSFLSEISNVKKTISVINIIWKDINNIKEIILKEQKLKNLNELRDKFEGVAYYETTHKKMAGVIALEKLFRIKFINWEIIKPKTYKPIIEILGKEYFVITTDFGTMPNIPKENKLPIILTVAKEEKVIWIIGLLPQNKLSDSSNFLTYIPIKSIDDLNCI
jgi:hypothetical protein